MSNKSNASTFTSAQSGDKFSVPADKPLQELVEKWNASYPETMPESERYQSERRASRMCASELLAAIPQVEARIADLKRQLAERDVPLICTCDTHSQYHDPKCVSRQKDARKATLDAHDRELRLDALKKAAQLMCIGCKENVESELYLGTKHQSEHVLYLKRCEALPIRQLMADLRQSPPAGRKP